MKTKFWDKEENAKRTCAEVAQEFTVLIKRYGDEKLLSYSFIKAAIREFEHCSDFPKTPYEEKIK